MRRTCLLASLALVVGALMLPSAAIGQVPTQDSVVANVPATASGSVFDIEIDARSGPSGENPSGTAFFEIDLDFPQPGSRVRAGGLVTCLAVSGRTATLVTPDGVFSSFVKMQVVDNQGTDLADTFTLGGPFFSDPGCSPLAGVGESVASGDITVVDAPALPTAKDQCKNNGWRNYPGFKNEGACVAFVATGGKRPLG